MFPQYFQLQHSFKASCKNDSSTFGEKDSFSFLQSPLHYPPCALGKGWKSVCGDVLKQRSVGPVAKAITSGEVSGHSVAECSI